MPGTEMETGALFVSVVVRRVEMAVMSKYVDMIVVLIAVVGVVVFVVELSWHLNSKCYVVVVVC